MSPLDIIVDRGARSFYYLILHYWIVLFGDSEVATRCLSVLFSFFTIFMTYKVGSLIFDKEVGLLSSFLVALSLFHIQYSQEVREYGLLALLSITSVYFFARLLYQRKPCVWIGYVLSSILLMNTHLYGVFIIMAQNLLVVTQVLFSKEVSRREFKQWIVLQFMLLALFAPTISLLARHALDMQRVSWLPIPYISSIIDSFVTYSSSNRILFIIFIVLSVLSLVAYEAMRGNMNWKELFRSIETYRWKIYLSNVRMLSFLLVWLLCPIIVPFIISRCLAPMYMTRYTIGGSLAFYLLIGKGISNIRHQYRRWVILGIVAAISLVKVWGYYAEVNHEEWRDVAEYVDANAERGDLLLFNAGFCLKDVFNYYSKRADVVKKPFPEKANRLDEENIKELAPTVEGYSRVWLIQSHHNGGRRTSRPELSPTEDLIQHRLRQWYSLTHHGRHKGIDVYLFQKE